METEPDPITQEKSERQHTLSTLPGHRVQQVLRWPQNRGNNPPPNGHFSGLWRCTLAFPVTGIGLCTLLVRVLLSSDSTELRLRNVSPLQQLSVGSEAFPLPVSCALVLCFQSPRSPLPAHQSPSADKAVADVSESVPMEETHQDHKYVLASPLSKMRQFYHTDTAKK